MTATDRLLPFFNSYSEKVKRKRKEVGMTVRELSEKSGVPYSNVSRVNSGSQANPLLYNEAAVADTLGLSLDELCGLKPPEGSIAEIQEENRKLEFENVRLTATVETQRAQIKAIHAICYVLVFFCLLLAMSLVIYLVIDSQITDAGIIRGGELSATAWILIGLIVASVIAAGITISRIIRKENGGEKTCSHA